MRLKLDNKHQKVPYSVIVASLNTHTSEEVAAMHGVSAATIQKASARAWIIGQQDMIRMIRVEKAAATEKKPRRSKTATTDISQSESRESQHKISAETKATHGVRKGLDLTRGLPLGLAVKWKQNKWHYFFNLHSNEYVMYLQFSDQTTKYRSRGYNLSIFTRSLPGRCEYRAANKDPMQLPKLLLARIPERDNLHTILSGLIQTDDCARG